MKQLRVGEDVLARDGSRLGTVERLVVDEGAHQVTDLVVRDHVVPLREFREAGPDGLATKLSEADLKRFPTHDAAALEAPGDHWQPPEGYQLHQFLAIAGALLGSAPYVPPVHADLTPGEAAHEITAGSPVWAGDRQIGHVAELVTDEAGRLKELVMTHDRHAIAFSSLSSKGDRLLTRGDKTARLWDTSTGRQIAILRRNDEKVIEVVGPNVQVELNETEIDLLEPYEPGAGE